MSSSTSSFFSGLAFRAAPSNAPLRTDKNQAKGEAAVLSRQADSEGWSDEKLTMALNEAAAKSNQSADTPSAAPTQVESEVQSNNTNSERQENLRKRQEVIRTIRQAEMEGWSDDKLVAALRMRLEIRQELRERASSL